MEGGGGGGGEVTISFFFIFYLVSLCLGCIPKISFVACLEVPQKFVWWWLGVESEFSDRLSLTF